MPLRSRSIIAPSVSGNTAQRRMYGILLVPLLVFGLCMDMTGQAGSEYQKLWSATDRIDADDFKLDLAGPSSSTCSASYSINYAVTGFDFLTKNFNQKVRTVMYTNASWLDRTADDTDRSLQFQQVLFDISELHARRFREQLLLNKGKIANGMNIVEEINARILKELTEERARFEQESSGGQLTDVMDEWASRIEREIRLMDEFRFENTKKIKLDK